MATECLTVRGDQRNAQEGRFTRSPLHGDLLSLASRSKSTPRSASPRPRTRPAPAMDNKQRSQPLAKTQAGRLHGGAEWRKFFAHRRAAAVPRTTLRLLEERQQWRKAEGLACDQLSDVDQSQNDKEDEEFHDHEQEGEEVPLDRLMSVLCLAPCPLDTDSCSSRASSECGGEDESSDWESPKFVVSIGSPSRGGRKTPPSRVRLEIDCDYTF